MPHLTIEQAIRDIKDGKMVILVDDEDRENEGDLCMAAEKVTAEAINFMATHGRGLICLSLTPDKVDALDLPLMVDHNTSPFETGFTVSVEARCGVTTGISAADRATTILTAVRDEARPTDLVRPGHIFPLRARKGGVMVRTGQTEGSVDLARLAGSPGAARAVGRVMSANPFPLIVPCHRVVNADGQPGQYSGGFGRQTKAWLIELERGLAPQS